MGWQLQRHKCKAWLPSAVGLVESLDSIVPQVLDGLPLLGSAMEGELETHLGPFGVSASPACARLTHALRFADQIKKLLSAGLDMPSAHIAWCLVHGSLAKSLDSHELWGAKPKKWGTLMISRGADNAFMMFP